MMKTNKENTEFMIKYKELFFEETGKNAIENCIEYNSWLESKLNRIESQVCGYIEHISSINTNKQNS